MKFYTICDEATMEATFPGEPLFCCSTCCERICLAADGDRCPRCHQIALDALRAARPQHVEQGCTCPACMVAATAEGHRRIADWNAYVTAVDAQEDRRRALEPFSDISVLPAIGGALFSRSLSDVWTVGDVLR